MENKKSVINVLTRAYFKSGKYGYFKIAYYTFLLIALLMILKDGAMLLGFVIIFLMIQSDYYSQLYVESQASLAKCKEANAKMSKDNLDLIKKQKQKQKRRILF